MIPTPPALAYRRAAAQQASVLGLVIALYDTLAGNLQRAAEAMRRLDLEQRGEQLKHGFAVLTQLVSLVDSERGGPTAAQLGRSYQPLRQQILLAQFEQNASLRHSSQALVLDVRSAWQELDLRSASAEPSLVGASTKPAPLSLRA